MIVEQQLKNIIEAALMAADEPLSIEQLTKLFEESEQPGNKDIRAALHILAEDCQHRGIEIQEVASGFRFQVRQEYGAWVSKLWEEKPPRYSRAMLETLALIAYRQPVTRAEIEEVRGVAVSSQIMKTLVDREWIKLVGYKDIPGKPALYGTTKQFLDYFNLKNLEDLPALMDLQEELPVDAV